MLQSKRARVIAASLGHYRAARYLRAKGWAFRVTYKALFNRLPVR